MSIRILAVGKKHESWIVPGVDRYQKRLRKPWDVNWQLISHSNYGADRARVEESDRILAKLKDSDWVILLDERGKLLDSPQLSQHLTTALATKQVTIVIGGAFGVDQRVRARANLIWSLSPLVFPHQLVRLMLAEQLYRAAEIQAGKPYHHL